MAEDIIDFTKAEDEGGGAIRVPEGDYLCKIVGGKRHESSKGTLGIHLTLQVTGGQADGTKFADYLYVTPKSLWRLRDLLQAVGVKVPNRTTIPSVIKITRGKPIAVSLADDEYEGKIRSRVVSYMLPSVLEPPEEDVEEEETEESAAGPQEAAATARTNESEDSGTDDLDDLDLDEI